LPEAQTHQVTPERKLGEIVKKEPEDLTESMVRQVLSGVTFSVKTAKIYHAWLGEQIATAEKIDADTEEKK
jgi:hypothetical protein